MTIIRNRKLIPNDPTLWTPEFIAEVEKQIAEVPMEAWRPQADKAVTLNGMFSWTQTMQGYSYWNAIDDHFTVAPLNPPDRKAALIAERDRIDAEIEVIEGE